MDIPNFMGGLLKGVFLSILAVSALSCTRSKDLLSDSEREALMQKGEEMVVLARTELSTALNQQIQDSGIMKAIAYCNTHAPGIMAGVSEKSGYRIYRRSEKFRNPGNKPSATERNALKVFAYALKHNQPLHPLLQWNERDSSYVYYAPIVMQTSCLNCHGTRENGLAEETFERIMELYPNDKAFNYKAGDLRGMWVVEL